MGDCVICKRCERVERQRDELIKVLEILEKIFADKDFIEEDEQEDFLFHVWTLAHGALYNLKRELALEREYLELARREAAIYLPEEKEKRIKESEAK